MYCGHCGKEIEDNSKFCKYCGGANVGDNTYTEEAAHVTAPKRVWVEKVIVLVALTIIAVLFLMTGFLLPCLITVIIMLFVLIFVKQRKSANENEIRMKASPVTSQPAGEIYVPTGNVSNRKTVLGIAVAAMTLFESIGWLLPCVANGSDAWWDFSYSVLDMLKKTYNKRSLINESVQNMYFVIVLICVSVTVLFGIAFFVVVVLQKQEKRKVFFARACAVGTVGWISYNLGYCIYLNNVFFGFDTYMLSVIGWILLVATLFNAIILTGQYQTAIKQSNLFDTRNASIMNPTVTEVIRKCSQCGNINAGDNMFCGKCGSRLQG